MSQSSHKLVFMNEVLLEHNQLIYICVVYSCFYINLAEFNRCGIVF